MVPRSNIEGDPSQRRHRQQYIPDTGFRHFLTLSKIKKKTYLALDTIYSLIIVQAY